MMGNASVLVAVLICFNHCASEYVNKSHPKPWKVRFYPKGTIFLKSDLLVKGCSTFRLTCPRQYRNFMICARHYEGHYKTFDNYCEMEYENCNSWRQWNVIKKTRC